VGRLSSGSTLAVCVGGIGGWEPLQFQLPVPLALGKGFPAIKWYLRLTQAWPGRFLLAKASDRGNKSPPLFI